ncbi:MAG: DUF4405 domain-containing protein [Lachnospiraceae bacterium]|nr:DUF4405 domain-containing protein [Lachnospiraceae bacterium]
MKTKAKIKWTLDVLMTAALFFLMGYQFWGETAHEWIGAGMLVLFVVHQVLNRSWYKNLFQGRYTPMRTLQCLVNVLTLAAMLALMYSGITMSRHVFAFLPIRGGLMLARRLHILGSYWGYLLMSLHLGLHWGMVCWLAAKKRSPKRKYQAAGLIISLLIAAYGVRVFIRRNFLTYLFLRSEFVFLDYEEPKLKFFLDCLALMGLCVFAAHYGAKLVKRMGKT